MIQIFCQLRCCIFLACCRCRSAFPGVGELRNQELQLLLQQQLRLWTTGVCNAQSPHKVF
jgi:hypothetical protein